MKKTTEIKQMTLEEKYQVAVNMLRQITYRQIHFTDAACAQTLKEIEELPE